MPVLPLLFIHVSRREPHRVLHSGKANVNPIRYNRRNLSQPSRYVPVQHVSVLPGTNSSVRCAAQKPCSTLFLFIPLSNVMSAFPLTVFCSQAADISWNVLCKVSQKCTLSVIAFYYLAFKSSTRRPQLSMFFSYCRLCHG